MKNSSKTKKRTYRSRKGRYGRFAKSVAKIAKSVVKNSGERKYFDVNINHAALTTGPVYTLMSNIVQGSSQHERIGDRILLKSMYMQTTILMSPLVNETKYRILIVRQKGVSGGPTPTVTDILLPHTSTLRVNSAVDTDKFTIVYDKVHVLNVQYPYQRIEFKLKFNSSIAYNDTSAIPAREYHFVSMSDAGFNGVAVTGNLRIKYTDL